MSATLDVRKELDDMKELKECNPFNDTDELDKLMYTRLLLDFIKELEERVHNLELRLGYSDRR
jgi:hypothetical protein